MQRQLHTTAEESMPDVDVKSHAFAVDIIATRAIEASSTRVWNVLTATGQYGEWNPFIRRFAGSLTVGAPIEVELQLAGRKSHQVRPRIVDLKPGRSFEWFGHSVVAGLFVAPHRFVVEPIGPGRSRLTQSETVSGVLVPVFRSMLTGPTPEAFAAMNDALAKRVLDS